MEDVQRSTVFARNCSFLVQAHVLVAYTPIDIVPSPCRAWHYTVRQVGRGTEFDRFCDIEQLPKTVADALHECGYVEMMEEERTAGVVARVLERLNGAERKNGGHAPVTTYPRHR